jgi:hypothetical protein
MFGFFSFGVTHLLCIFAPELVAYISYNTKVIKLTERDCEVSLFFCIASFIRHLLVRSLGALRPQPRGKPPQCFS